MPGTLVTRVDLYCVSILQADIVFLTRTGRGSYFYQPSFAQMKKLRHRECSTFVIDFMIR